MWVQGCYPFTEVTTVLSEVVHPVNRQPSEEQGVLGKSTRGGSQMRTGEWNGVAPSSSLSPLTELADFSWAPLPTKKPVHRPEAVTLDLRVHSKRNIIAFLQNSFYTHLAKILLSKTNYQLMGACFRKIFGILASVPVASFDWITKLGKVWQINKQINIGTHCVLDLCWNDKSHSSLFAIFKTYSEDKTTRAIILVIISPSTIVNWVHNVAIVALRASQLTCWSYER